MKILITGAAGFIGFHLSKKLLEKKCEVYGIDNLNSYYDVELKKAREKFLYEKSNQNSVPFEAHKIDLENMFELDKIFSGLSSKCEYFKINRPTEIVNLAAQAGVRYSLVNPGAYVKSNLEGFINILECARNYKVNHLVYASSSSVYGGNTSLPFKEEDSVDQGTEDFENEQEIDHQDCQKSEMTLSENKTHHVEDISKQELKEKFFSSTMTTFV